MGESEILGGGTYGGTTAASWANRSSGSGLSLEEGKEWRNVRRNFSFNFIHSFI